MLVDDRVLLEIVVVDGSTRIAGPQDTISMAPLECMVPVQHDLAGSCKS